MNVPEVDIVIPTWQRPEKLERCLNSIRLQTYRYIQVFPIEDTERLFAFGVWNRFLTGWDGDLFVYLCDDTELSPVCIEAAVHEITGRWPDMDGMCGFHQQIAGKDGFSNSAMGMFGRPFAERFPNRQAFCPDYSRFHADSELGKYARSISRFAYTSQASLIHHHPVHERNEMDNTHHVVREPGAVAHDRETYERRRDTGLLWGQTFERVNRNG